MYDVDSVYRPPSEEKTIVLQVTMGCSHNACAFCGLYKNQPFRLVAIEEIIQDLKRINHEYPLVDRIYLIHGDAFVMSYAQLENIINQIKKYLPNIITIAMFASISNISKKSDEELRNLSKLGVNDLTIGIESGWDDVLTRMHKGHSSKDVIAECKRLDQANIKYFFSLMTGIGGRLFGRENAHITAEVINRTNPVRIDVAGLTLFPETELAQQVKENSFIESTEYEMVEELISLIEKLSIHTYIDATHCTTPIRVSGKLPEDKNKILSHLNASLKDFNEKKLRRRREKYMGLNKKN